MLGLYLMFVLDRCKCIPERLAKGVLPQLPFYVLELATWLTAYAYGGPKPGRIKITVMSSTTS
eukprot:598529-Amphidinium_carterae.1